MAKKDEVRHDAPFNFGESPLIKGTEQKLVEGFQKMESEETMGDTSGDNPRSAIGDSTEGTVPTVSAAATVKRAMESEPTKGIQTNVPMSVYRRLNDIKLSRGETIGNLVAEAVLFWLDVQEGKRKVSETI